jgi:aldehyde:ferredoxin oxidoreductase
MYEPLAPAYAIDFQEQSRSTFSVFGIRLRADGKFDLCPYSPPVIIMPPGAPSAPIEEGQMNAATGKLLEVNLSSHTCRAEQLPTVLYRQYLGGYGLGVRLLLERMDPACDPLGPENILGFAAGYLTGTGAYIASRYMVFGKSPSTGGWGDSNCGGHIGKKLKNSGFDVLLASGIAQSPVYLLVEDGKGQILDAAELWGRDCYATEGLLKARHGKDCEVACIGPAGENLSPIAGISTDKGRFAARSGLGAVMGSKRLKAVVLKGSQPIEIADPERMKALRKEHLPLFKDDFGATLTKYGTPMFYEAALKTGDAPWKNWSSSVAEMENFTITADKVLEYQVKRYACSGCPIGCGGHVEVREGQFQLDGAAHKAEYETMGVFGSNLLIDDLEAIFRINDLCNRYGMDTIGCGGLAAYAVECFERGLITREQTGGLELTWGNAEAVVSLVEQIGKGEGIGGVLARGFDAAVDAYGSGTADCVMAVRGEALPAHDPRWNVGLALTYFLNPTPAHHCQGSTAFPMAGYEMPAIAPAEASGRAAHHDAVTNWTHVLDAAGLCLFGYFILSYKTLPEYLAAADGSQWTTEELEAVGLRIAIARQIFNVRAGWTLDRYSFPERVLGNPPLTSGETKGVRIDLQTMVDEYLDLRGFDRKTGLPPRSELERLGLADLLG